MDRDSLGYVGAITVAHHVDTLSPFWRVPNAALSFYHEKSVKSVKYISAGFSGDTRPVGCSSNRLLTALLGLDPFPNHSITCFELGFPNRPNYNSFVIEDLVGFEPSNPSTQKIQAAASVATRLGDKAPGFFCPEATFFQ